MESYHWSWPNLALTPSAMGELQIGFCHDTVEGGVGSGG
jgi:hypothetical protein